MLLRPAMSPLALLDSAITALETPSVVFEIAHDRAERSSRRSGPFWSTRYTTRMNGHDIHVRTRRLAWAEGNTQLGWTSRDKPVQLTKPRTSIGRLANGLIITGIAAGEPDFLDTYEEQLDILMTVADGPYHLHHGPRMGEAIMVMAKEASESAGLPVTFVRAPASGFELHPGAGHVSRTRGDPSLALAPAVRMTVGLDSADRTDRLKLLKHLTMYAQGHGYGLHVAPITNVAPVASDVVRGEWVTLAAASAVHSRPDLPSMAGARATMPGVIATIIGPSRQGSFAAVMQVLAARGVNPVSVASMTWNDIAFVHVAAPFDHSARWPFGSQPIATTGAARGHIVVCSLQRLEQERPGGRPVYATWEVRVAPPGQERETDKDPTGPSLHVVDVLVDLARNHRAISEIRVDLNRHRPTPNGRISGRIKLSVWLRRSVTDTEDFLAAVCAELQRDARRRLESEKQPVSRLRVDWRERWLGASHDGSR